MIKVVHFSLTPLAAAPYQIWQCLKKYSDLDVHLVQDRDRYADGRKFPYSLIPRLHREEVTKVFKEAHIVHIHNYLPQHIKGMINKNKQKVVATLHSCPRQGNWKELQAFVHKTFCIRQPMQMAEYKGFPTLPNLFDIYEYPPNGRVSNKVVFAPTNRNERTHPASKGFSEVTTTLQTVRKRQPNISIDIIEKVPYIENLKRKQKASIIIDDLVPGHNTFHLTSLEGASFGACVFSGVGEKDGFPFIKEDFNSFGNELCRLLESPEEVKERGDKNRAWIEKSWDPKVLAQEYVEEYKKL